MDVRAIIVLAGAETNTETFAGIPLASLDVLGRSVLLRVVDRLARFGIGSMTALCDRALQLPSMPQGFRIFTRVQDVWQSAVHVFSGLVNGGAEVVLALRLGPYAEIDYDDLIQFHIAQHRPMTAVLDPRGKDSSTFVFNASLHNEAPYVLRHQLKTSRHPYSVYGFSGYSNQLRGAADLRRLAIDSFCRNAELTPAGTEMKPGIWVNSNAVIHHRARIVAPAFIGASARIGAASAITRCSALEHHAHIGPGTIVDNATILPNTRIGAQLDVAHAVVGFDRLAHLDRNVEVEIFDPRLVGPVSAAPVRLLEHVASLAAYLPLQFLRGLVPSNGNGKASHTPASAQSPHPALARATEEEVPANFAGVRRYGNE